MKRSLGRTKLMPEKLRGTLRWSHDEASLRLQQGAIVVATWDPWSHGDRGAISIYGEPRGKIVFYRTWKGWTDRLWKLYRVRPPTTYHKGGRQT